MTITAKINNLTLRERTWESVQTKMAAQEETWKSCIDWINNTGQGGLANPLEGKEHFDTCVTKCCSFC